MFDIEFSASLLSVSKQTTL